RALSSEEGRRDRVREGSRKHEGRRKRDRMSEGRNDREQSTPGRGMRGWAGGVAACDRCSRKWCNSRMSVCRCYECSRDSETYHNRGLRSTGSTRTTASSRLCPSYLSWLSDRRDRRRWDGRCYWPVSVLPLHDT
ncbi:hypothetical protein PENTCL1PPCAC_26697, partial [Pristionchus entomophagus]